MGRMAQPAQVQLSSSIIRSWLREGRMARWPEVLQSGGLISSKAISKKGHGAPNTPMHPAAQGAEASDCPVQTGLTRG